MSSPFTTGTRIADTADRLSRVFARELARVLIDAERALQPILRQALDGDRSAQVSGARGIALRNDLRKALQRAGFDDLVNTTTAETIAQLSQAVLSTRIGRAGVGLIQPHPEKLRALYEVGRSNLLQVGDDVAAALWRSTAQWAFSVRPMEDILDDLLNAMDDDVANLHTLFDTQVSVLGRQIEALATEDLPADQPFLYVGPADEKNREFCKDHLGLVLTRDKIEALDNGQLPNPFVTAGGYNCRHSWLAVESAELRALANTGKRAPEFAGVGA